MTDKVIISFANLIPTLFYILFFSVPLVLFPNTSELFEFNKMVLTYALTSLIVAAWMTKMILQRKIIFRRTILDIPLVVFLSSQLISTIISIDFRTSLLGYYSRFHGGFLSSLSYSLLFWAYVANMDAKKTKRAIYTLLISALLVSIYGILEHFGIDKDIWVQDVQNRVFSTLGQPNWLAAFLVALLPITWLLALQEKFKEKRYFYWIGLSFVFFLTLLYTKSRSGILGFAVAFISFWGVYFWLKKERFKKHINPFIHISFIIFAITALVGTPWTPSVGQFFTIREAPVREKPQGPALEVGGTESGEIRKIVWRGATDLWKNYPILGTGVETFAYSYYNFRPVEHNLVSEWDFLYNKAHNEYLNFAATTGTLGFASYLFLIGAGIYLFFTHIFKGEKVSLWSLSLFAGYLSILVTNFFGFSVIPVSLQLFLYPAFAITLIAGEKQRPVKQKRLSNDQKVFLGILVFIFFFILLSIVRYWYADILYTRAKIENRLENYTQGQELIKRAVKLSSKEAIFWDELAESSTKLALALEEAGDRSLAEKYANQAIEESNVAISLSPRNVNLLRNQSRLYIKLSQIDPNYFLNAREVLAQSIQLAPTDAKLYYNLGLTHARIGEIEEAIKVLEETISLKPNYRNARFALALLLIDQGEIQTAKEELNYILENVNPEDTLVRQTLEEL